MNPNCGPNVGRLDVQMLRGERRADGKPTLYLSLPAGPYAEGAISVLVDSLSSHHLLPGTPYQVDQANHANQADPPPQPPLDQPPPPEPPAGGGADGNDGKKGGASPRKRSRDSVSEAESGDGLEESRPCCSGSGGGAKTGDVSVKNEIAAVSSEGDKKEEKQGSVELNNAVLDSVGPVCSNKARSMPIFSPGLSMLEPSRSPTLVVLSGASETSSSSISPESAAWLAASSEHLDRLVLDDVPDLKLDEMPVSELDNGAAMSAGSYRDHDKRGFTAVVNEKVEILMMEGQIEKSVQSGHFSAPCPPRYN